MFNPEGWLVGQTTLAIEGERNTARLLFKVIAAATYVLSGERWLVEFTDFTITAQCPEKANPRAIDGSVTATIRVLSDQMHRVHRVLFWEEPADFAGDILSKAGQQVICHAFSAGPDEYQLFAGGPQGERAEVALQQFEDGAVRESPASVRYWVYRRELRPDGVTRPVSEYLLIEDWAGMGVCLRRGRDLKPGSVRVV